MICAKVLFSWLKRDLNLKKLKNLDRGLIAFPLRSDKVMLCSTVNIMTDICEPPRVYGMKVLDRNAFKKTVTVPCLIVKCKVLKEVQQLLKNFLLKVLKLKSIAETEGDMRKILFNPNLLKNWNDLDENIIEELKKLSVNESDFSNTTIELGYENWHADALLRAILPSDTLMLRSYSLIGHIVHLNIKEELSDYKHIIAEILYDKIPTAKTVICKKNIIENVYRNFEMELLCGEPNFIASVSENHCTYELDFSKVYWNPRLGTEHSRVVESLKQGDVLFDVFAGIGPFAIPAGKKKCSVFANDLNPESIKWLERNINSNKKAKPYVKCFNKDGGNFISEDVKENMLKFWKDESFSGKIHIVMNLPAIAPTFMKHFKRLYTKNDLEGVEVEKIKKCLPIINCYFFTHGEECGKGIFEEQSDMKLDKVEHSLHFVRKVSNSGLMYKIVFTLPFEYLADDCEAGDSDEPLAKRICTKQM